jgi:hypothetical protein
MLRAATALTLTLAVISACLHVAAASAATAAAAAAVPPFVEHGWLGLTTDAYGLYAQPPPALDSLHEDYQFLRRHEMAAGRLELESVAAFGDSAHVRLQPALAPHNGSSDASITLELCGGDTAITLKLAVPPSRTCASQKIFNNSNSAGWTTQIATTAPNKTLASPAWCQSLCCANPDCVGFTFTDPQPGAKNAYLLRHFILQTIVLPRQARDKHRESTQKREMCVLTGGKANGDPHICWQYTGGPMRVVTPGGAMCDGSGDGHCWSALGSGGRTGKWSVEVDGAKNAYLLRHF